MAKRKKIEEGEMKISAENGEISERKAKENENNGETAKIIETSENISEMKENENEEIKRNNNNNKRRIMKAESEMAK
jgi:hypothetical protein